MKALSVKARAVLFGLLGLVVVVVRRLLRVGKPLKPGWTFQAEYAVYMALWFQRRYPSFDIDIVRGLIGDIPPSRNALRLVDIEETTLAGVHAFRVRPKTGTTRRLLHFHGGGYIIGTASGCREFLARFCPALGAEAITVDYRLAPEHPYPAALEDAVDCYEALLAEGTRPEDIFVGGESAGGGLALALLLKLRDTGRPLPAGAFTYSPWVQVDSDRPSYLENAESDILALEGIRRGRELYLDGHDPADPYISPIHGDLRALPPQYMLAGGGEVFRDDIREMYRLLREAGVESVLEEEPHMPHTWLYLTPAFPHAPVAVGALGQRVREFWDRVTGVPAGRGADAA